MTLTATLPERSLISSLFAAAKRRWVLEITAVAAGVAVVALLLPGAWALRRRVTSHEEDGR